MLDPRLVTNDPDRIRACLKRRNAGDETLEALERVISVVQHRRAAQTESDALRAERNALSKQIGGLMRDGKREEAAPLQAKVKDGAARLHALEHERKDLEEQEKQLLLGLPNLLDDAVPDGVREEDNEEVRRWGEPPVLDFDPKPHDELGAALGLLDFSRAAKLSGARFSVLYDGAARLERALISYFIDRAVDAGYREVMVPYIVSRETLTGTGNLPKFEHDVFRLAGEVNGSDAFLIPTAEVPVTGLHGDEILAEDELPLCYASFTPCFRSEAGSYGKDTRGLIRQHQFHKVELVKIATPEQSDQEHRALTAHAESLLQELGLHYRTVVLCSGDTGFGAQLCFDIEVWLPGQGAYREISSCSNYGDFQARRFKMRYRPSGGGKPRLCHTINGSGLAVGRTLIAILENYQQADGTISVPEVLRPYMGGVDQIGKAE